MCQERWSLEDDSGKDSWIGSVFASACKRKRWNRLVLVGLSSLLVDAKSVGESLSLHHREGFDATCSEDRVSGANWAVFEYDLLAGLQTSHADIMAARGGLTWALRKPLYPFKIGEYHNPRGRARLPVDLRLISPRIREVFIKTSGENFSSPRFNYNEWIKNSGWEQIYTDSGPRVIVVEPTNECSGNCLFCPQSTHARPRGQMEPAIFSLIHEDLATLTDLRWVFSGLGEPLLNTHLSTMLRMTENRHSLLKTSLNHDPGPNFPWQALDQVSLSVDALEKSLFQKLRPGCSWEAIENFLIASYELKKADPDGRPEIGVTFLKHKSNAACGLAFLQYWKKVCSPIFRDHFFRWPFDLPPEKVQWFQILGVSDFLGQIPFMGETRYCPLKRRPCLHALLNLHILWDGTASLCPYDYEGKWSLGKIGDATPMQIWQSDKAKNIRKQHLAMSFEENHPCVNCQDWYHK